MKKIFKLLFTGIVLFTMTGCGADQTPLTAVDVWEKPGADELEIKKALLECGMPTPSGISSESDLNISESYSDIHEKINADASIDACLIQAGFHHRLGAMKWCEKYKDAKLPICQPEAVIPQRSVEKRLNSPYCKKNADQPECQP